MSFLLAPTPDPFATPLSIFENEIVFTLGRGALTLQQLNERLDAYGDTEIFEWANLSVEVPLTLAKLAANGWVVRAGDYYGLTFDAFAFVGDP